MMLLLMLLLMLLMLHVDAACSPILQTFYSRIVAKSFLSDIPNVLFSSNRLPLSSNSGRPSDSAENLNGDHSGSISDLSNRRRSRFKAVGGAGEGGGKPLGDR